MLDSILTLGKIAGAAKSTIDAYKAISGIINGGTRSEKALDEIASHLKNLNQEVVQLSENILYAPHLDVVHNLNRQNRIDNLRDIREKLSPIQHAFGAKILSSSVIETPEKMQKQFAENPWDVLSNVRPIAYASPPMESGYVPIAFEFENKWYIGWQKIGALPSLFDCQFNDFRIVSNAGNSTSDKSEKIFNIESYLEIVNCKSITKPLSISQDNIDLMRNKAQADNDAFCQYVMGVVYEQGTKTIQADDDKAVNWYRKSAEQGHPNAQFALGYMYENGRGVNKDVIKATMYYRKAAEQNFELAQYNLACNYVLGRGVEKDYYQAFVWALKAADRGEPVAQNYLGIAYSNGLGVMRNYVLAKEWFLKASKQGYADSQFRLGVLYMLGQGGKPNPSQGSAWLAEAAKQGHEEAKRFLKMG